MSDINFTHYTNQARASHQAIDSLENRIAQRLPSDYRSFLLEHNGGRPSKRHFVDHDGTESWVDYFLTVDDDSAAASEIKGYASIQEVHSRIGDYIPDDCLIIGIVCRDNPVLLRYDGGRKGEIDIKGMTQYLGILTTGTPEELKNSGVYNISRFFSDFINMLH